MKILDRRARAGAGPCKRPYGDIRFLRSYWVSLCLFRCRTPNRFHPADRPRQTGDKLPDTTRVMPGNDDRTPGGYQSKSRSSRRLDVAQRRDSSKSRERTMHGDHTAISPTANWDERDSEGISDRRTAPSAGYWRAVPDRAARTPLCRAKSRMSLEFRLRCLRKSRGITTIRFPGFVKKCRQRRTRAGVADDAFPGRIAIQFWEETGQVRDEFMAFFGRQVTDGGLDFLQRAHCGKLRGGGCYGKLQAPTGIHFYYPEKKP